MSVGLNFDAAEEAIARGGEGSGVMANVIISTYWQRELMSLHSLKVLDKSNRKLAYAIIDYRNQPGWDDHKFWQLALRAKKILAK